MTDVLPGAEGGMSEDALRLVCEVADEWAGEYGFTHPEHATAIRQAIYRICPGVLSQRDREFFERGVADV